MKPVTGKTFPDFTLNNQDGEPVSLKDLKGKKIALYFYSQDGSGTCLKESLNLRDHHASLSKKGITVIGVSPDSEKRHKNFIAKQALPFMLLVDKDIAFARALGIWGAKEMFGRIYDGLHRTTYLINEQGILEHIIYPVESGKHAQQILETWGL